MGRSAGFWVDVPKRESAVPSSWESTCPPWTAARLQIFRTVSASNPRAHRGTFCVAGCYIGYKFLDRNVFQLVGTARTRNVLAPKGSISSPRLLRMGSVSSSRPASSGGSVTVSGSRRGWAGTSPAAQVLSSCS